MAVMLCISIYDLCALLGDFFQKNDRISKRKLDKEGFVASV